jgi:hypothetical protein
MKCENCDVQIDEYSKVGYFTTYDNYLGICNFYCIKCYKQLFMK